MGLGQEYLFSGHRGKSRGRWCRSRQGGFGGDDRRGPGRYRERRGAQVRVTDNGEPKGTASRSFQSGGVST